MKRRPNSPISQVQRELAEKEAHLKREMETLQRQIAEAPARKQEQLKMQHHALLQRYEQRRGADFISSIPDKRHTFNASLASAPRGRRKGEKKALLFQFLALLVLLGIAIFLLLQALPW